MTALVDLCTHNALRSQADGLGLHALHRQFAGIAIGLAAARANGRANGDELGQRLAPLVARDFQSHTHDAISSELVSLLFHARHCQFAGMVHSLGQNDHLLVLAPSCLLITDVIDRTAHDEANRVKTRLADQQELIHTQVAGEEWTVSGITAHDIQSFECVAWQVAALWWLLLGHDVYSFTKCFSLRRLLEPPRVSVIAILLQSVPAFHRAARD